MKTIYTRTIGVYDDKLGEAMEISKSLAEVRKKHYPNHEVYFSFQIGGNPRTVRETLVGEQFTDKAFENDQNMSADPKFVELQKKMKGVFKEGITISTILFTIAICFNVEAKSHLMFCKYSVYTLSSTKL